MIKLNLILAVSITVMLGSMLIIGEKIMATMTVGLIVQKILGVLCIAFAIRIYYRKFKRYQAAKAEAALIPIEVSEPIQSESNADI